MMLNRVDFPLPEAARQHHQLAFVEIQIDAAQRMHST